MMMASFNRRRCYVAILFLLVASVIGSSSGTSLRSKLLLKKETEKEASRAAEVKTSVTTPAANLVETSTETVEQFDPLPSVNSTINTIKPSPDNPLSEPMEEQQNERNVSRSADGTSLSPSRAEPEYQLNQEISTRRPIVKESAPRETPHRKTNRTTLSTPAPVFDEVEPGKSVRSEKEEDGYKFHAEDLLMPIPQSVYLLAQLMSLSIQNLDTAFRGSLRIQSPIVQYPHSFRTTLLQISQKLSNAFLVSSTNADKIKMHSLFVPSKVKEATGYLEKFTNSSRMAEFLYLPLKNLKETTDQTFNLSSQIANHFGELVQLVDEVIQSHKFSMSTKERQVRNTTTELNRENEEKKRTETEILFKEKEIENLKRQKQMDEEEFDKAMDDLNYLQNREYDESQCYWRYNWRTIKNDWWYCPPYKPDPYQVRQANQMAREAKKKLEITMKSLSGEEEEAAKKREVDSDLKIRIERLNHEMNQLNEDVQLLRNTSIPLSLLRQNSSKLDKNWNKFVDICGKLQSRATKSLDVIQEANRTSTLWNNQLSESILLNLNKTNEDLSLVKSVIDIYLEGSNIEIIREIVTEVEQMLTMRGNIGELESRLQAKCDVASREIKNLLERNQRQTESQPSKLIKPGKDKRFEK